MRIVVFCPNPIGDTVMATPVFRALRAAYPDAAIDAVLRPVCGAVLEGLPWINERIPFDPRSNDRSLRTPPLLRRLRGNRYEVALLLPNSFRTALIATLGGIRRRVGYDRGGRGILLTDRLRPRWTMRAASCRLPPSGTTSTWSDIWAFRSARTGWNSSRRTPSAG